MFHVALNYARLRQLFCGWRCSREVPTIISEKWASTISALSYWYTMRHIDSNCSIVVLVAEL